MSGQGGPSRSLGGSLGPGLGLAVALWAPVGCQQPDPPVLVAQPGCGIGDDLVDNLRVKARGDFPDGSGTEVRLSEGMETLAWGDLPVAGVTVEGLFGGAVEAVGRTARLEDDGPIPVYFARVDGLCPVDDQGAAPREAVAAAVGSVGDVVLVGGTDVLGSPRDDVLWFDDQAGTLQPVPGQLPRPVVGPSISAIGERSFLMLGGASTDGIVRAEAVVIDLDDEVGPVGDTITVPMPQNPARAYHAAAVAPSGLVLVVGGCQRVTPTLECITEPETDPHVDGPPVLETSMWIEPGDSLNFSPGPASWVARFGATLMFARDGVAFLAGGYDATGQPVHVVERRRPSDPAFFPYGEPESDQEPPDTTPIVGAALQEGGIVLLALADGRVLSVNERGRTEFPRWCDGNGPCFSDTASRRGVITLPGERILADGMLLPVGGVGLGGDNAADLFEVGPRNPTPPPRRFGALPVPLDDGTVLMLGGRHSDSGALAQPVALRMRPALDGPDESIPDLDRALAGSLVASDFERVTLEPGGTVRLLADPMGDEQFPPVRVHARGFRSTSVRFEITMFTQGSVVPYLMLEHGAVEAVSISLQEGGVRGHVRSPDGTVVEVSCASQGIDPSQLQVLRFDVSPDGVTVSRGGDTVAQCPGLGDQPWSVGVGASGSGELQISGLRLSRR